MRTGPLCVCPGGLAAAANSSNPADGAVVGVNVGSWGRCAGAGISSNVPTGGPG